MRCLLVVGAAVLAVTVSATAAAAPPERIHVEFDNVDENFCDVEGLTVEIHDEVDAQFHPTTRRGLIHFDDHFRISSVYTNADTGAFVTARDTVHSKDISVTDNGDGTLTIINFGTGNATVHGANGKAIARNPGQVRFEIVVDHGGTPGDPEDDELISETLIKGSTGRTDDFCEAVVPALT
jgi:hypothetical protein